ncbi:MAG TPA: DUF4173 domain-containing protein, partial [Roseiflexaceae bacterium]|nr:DUF4173 domain-containing protein [Roseiflexaceae bacterium]
LSMPLQLSGSTEALTILIVVDLLFGGFMLVQAAYLFGGLDTLERSGMSYATYARRGFFELLAVAILALGLLWGLAAFTIRTQRRERIGFNIACTLMILLVLGLLASAFQRMQLYELAYGFTHLRIYTQSFMILLAVVLLLFLVALLRDRLRIFPLGSMVAALIYLAVLNLANPDALIVRENIARYHATGDLDAIYLASLSTDATIELVAAFPALGPAEQQIIGWGLQRHLHQMTQIDTSGGLPSRHLEPAARGHLGKPSIIRAGYLANRAVRHHGRR